MNAHLIDILARERRAGLLSEAAAARRARTARDGRAGAPTGIGLSLMPHVRVAVRTGRRLVAILGLAGA